MYIYIYIYMYVFLFPGPRAGEQQISQVVTGTKIDILWRHLAEASSGCLEPPQRIVLDYDLESSWISFCTLRPRVCAACENVFPRNVSQSKDQKSLIAKTCKPSSMSFKTRRGVHDGVCPPRCVPTEFILLLKNLFWGVQTVTQMHILWHII